MTPAHDFPEPTNTEAIRVIGRFEAGRGIPDAMRSDVRMLGMLLGQVLREAGGDELFDDVERLRLATIQAYDEETPGAFDRAAAIAESFTVARADEVARAFTCYFHLVNLAEEHQRVRVLRERAGQPVPSSDSATAGRTADTVATAYAQLRSEVGDDEARRRLAGLRFHPVFTAHPTEARRRAVSSSIRRLSELLTQHDAASEGGSEQHRAHRRMLEEIETLWRTAPLRSQKPSPTDEVRTVMGVFDETLFTTVPHVYRRIDDALRGEDSGSSAPIVPAFVRIGSWVGGDRDGNPFVTASVTREASQIAADHVLRGLERALDRIGRTLTLAADDTPPSAAVTALWEQFAAAEPEVAAELATRSPDEPHRRVLLILARRVAATRRGDGGQPYSRPEELLADLRAVQSSLADAGAKRHAYGGVQHLIWQVETYGFHLTELEVRQHSQVHRKALAELESGEAVSAQTEEVLEVFRVIAEIQRDRGLRAAGRYVVSFTQAASDLANVHRLARHALGDDAPPVLDVVPLFETFADLQAAPEILAEAVTFPEFRERMAATGNRLEVMLGYSDSSKDVGPVAANLALYEAQEKIARWAQESDIELTLFHGRGGALGRGGGPANSAILAQPPHSVDGRFKLTEQGEVIFARYGEPAIAMRHIDQVAAATLLASSPTEEQRTSSAAARYAEVAAIMDRTSRERFFSLVKAEGFASWFATVTPMEEIGLLALGSRPARRGLSVESLEDLRAIPWVFAWTQARINLAGWFGLGTALEAVGDAELLTEAYREWPLLRTMIDNVAMSLAKTDERIARQYLALGDRDDLAALVLDELALTRGWVIRLTGGKGLLENKPVLQRAVQLRSPYVDALSLLQLRALRALRSAPEEAGGSGADAEQQRLLLLSVSGVAAGLQNTG
ncbi:phosphoenolpyruvate carboxylase [Microbacterium sp. W4I20]|uniref:phosphoenolpyruvate carboxylase n=1 Tax=Microbacterium sp. W4I20 TaxID=3042262 RepID=UPI0027D88E49|nr:phosphoenolpyruvate carboxylase [Microbacterium sp. W4I20]